MPYNGSAMPQSFLAVGAAALLALLMLQTQRQRAVTGQDVVAVQVSTMTGRVATDVLDALRALPFDAATVSGTAASPTSLTPHRPLGTVASRFDSLSARTSYAGMPAPGTLDAMDGRIDTLSRVTPNGQIQFSVESVVGYVSADGQTPALTPTVLKMASVRVRPLGIEAEPFTVSQLYACRTGCTW